MKIYGNEQSACTRSVLMVFAEKNTPVEFVSIDLAKGENRSEEHLKRNPFGKIPVLETKHQVAYEAQAINRYLDKKLPGISLTPEDDELKLRMDKWMSIDCSYFTPQAYIVVLNKIFLPMFGGQPDQAAIKEASEVLKVIYKAMHDELENSEYLAGDEVSLADISFVQYTDYLLKAQCESIVFEHENVRRWWHKMTQRDSYTKLLDVIK